MAHQHYKTNSVLFVIMAA